MFNFFKKIFSHEEKKSQEIFVHENGFSLDEKFFSLEKIEKITAFKVDLVTYDSVCLQIEFEDKNKIFLDEEITGWDNLIVKLQEVLNCRLDWYEKIIFPPFERNETVIFSKSEKIQ